MWRTDQRGSLTVTSIATAMRSSAGRGAEAARRFEAFGVVTEQAFALLGQGRCLVRTSRPAEAAAVLRSAREIFDRLQAAPSRAQIDVLLRQAAQLSS